MKCPNVVQYVLVCIFLCPAVGNAFRQELYSESTYYQQYDLVTESRLRAFNSVWSSSRWELEPYLGVSFQYQTPGAKEKYFDNTVTPAVGLQLTFDRLVRLQAQGGVRNTVAENQSSAEWDPRIILSTGYFWTWNSLGFRGVFTEAYAESAYVPRLSDTPVSAFWIKQGYRFSPLSHFYLDPYAEFFLRDSRSQDLGPSWTQGRVGLRTQWAQDGWSVSALVYQNLKTDKSTTPWEGLLVLGGTF